MQNIYAGGGKCQRSASCLPSHFWPAFSSSLSSVKALTSCRTSHATTAGNSYTLTTRLHKQLAQEACTYALQNLALRAWHYRAQIWTVMRLFLVHLLTCAHALCSCQDFHKQGLKHACVDITATYIQSSLTALSALMQGNIF